MDLGDKFGVETLHLLYFKLGLSDS